MTTDPNFKRNGIVTGTCLACNNRSLFLGDGSYVTCGWVHCPDPTMVADILDHGLIDHKAAMVEMRKRGSLTDRTRLAVNAALGIEGGDDAE